MTADYGVGIRVGPIYEYELKGPRLSRAGPYEADLTERNRLVRSRDIHQPENAGLAKIIGVGAVKSVAGCHHVGRVARGFDIAPARVVPQRVW